MYKMSILAAFFGIVILLFPYHRQSAVSGEQTGLDVIPKPMQVRLLSGHFKITKSTVIVVKDDTFEGAKLGNYLAERIEEATGIQLAVNINPAAKPSKGSIVLTVDENFSSLGDEGYNLKITIKVISLSASKPVGIFYGIQTLRQMMPESEGNTVKIACAEIKDKPRYKWRGLLLDCCRHFLTTDFIKRYIDLLAYHKMNVLHWHLTEDQGWRLEIKQYPRLTEIGAWREENGQRYGGYYSQYEVKDIVAYAASRYVMIVPEIELPGHSTAALAAYPEFSCTGKPISVESHWGIFKDVYCPGKEGTFEFLQNIIQEVCELFPSPYIHIGGDEVPKDYWKACPDCQRRIKEESLKDEEELQGYMIKRIEKYMQSMGRNIIGWDEILEGGVTQTAIVQSWRSMEGAIEGTAHGNYVIVSPWDYTYFYCPQQKGEARFTFKTINSLERVYAFDPTPEELTPEQRKYVMGGEGCMWNEYTYQFEVDRQVFPRLCALSESLWSPAEVRDFSDFSSRLDSHYPRLEKLGVDYNKPEILLGEWKNEQLNRGVTQLWWDVTGHIKKNGIYRVNIVHERGEDEVLVYWAALFQDNEEVARYTHLSRSKRHAFMRYPLRLQNYDSNAAYLLRISMGEKKDGESSGSVYLRYFKDTGIVIR